ncbi:hypothetical protein [Inquilinus limosus]|uniref:Uncharacterized protein n=1 Tax=Inquilinus limosus TaxID=171674 RepID=A0A211Z6D9_9PROT|nr:hypothetical protein [Inquilinus limosus]OWJ60835.1 hypothetical protein BWR60_31575 [Inquilinus limosus]
MSGDSKPIPEPKLAIVRPEAHDPLDGSGAGDAPDGWHEPDRLGQPREPEAGPAARQMNAARIVDHLKSILSAARRDDA